MAFAVSDPSEGRMGVNAVTFTVANWDVEQIVAVNGLDDNGDDGDRSFVVVSQPALSSDSKFAGLDPPDVAVTNRDDDAAGLFVAAPSLLELTEAAPAAALPFGSPASQPRTLSSPLAATTCRKVPFCPPRWCSRRPIGM